MCQMPERSREAVVGTVVGGIREIVSSDHRRGAMGGVGGVVDEVDFPQEPLLMMLEFAHHSGGVSRRRVWLTAKRLEKCGQRSFGHACPIGISVVDNCTSLQTLTKVAAYGSDYREDEYFQCEILFMFSLTLADSCKSSTGLHTIIRILGLPLVECELSWLH